MIKKEAELFANIEVKCVQVADVIRVARVTRTDIIKIAMLQRGSKERG